MSITTAQIKELRQRTGAGILASKKALEATGGDIEAAIDKLRKDGTAKAAKKASREASEGVIISYIHGNPGRIGSLVELNCETDFVARTDGFKQLATDLAMHVAAANPDYLNVEDVPQEVLDREKETVLGQMADQKKPPEIMEKIISGKLDKWLDEIVFTRQSFVKDPDLSIDELVKRGIAELGENIVIRRFSRFEVGGGA